MVIFSFFYKAYTKPWLPATGSADKCDTDLLLKLESIYWPQFSRGGSTSRDPFAASLGVADFYYVFLASFDSSHCISTDSLRIDTILRTCKRPGAGG